MSRLKKFLVDIDLSNNIIKNVSTPIEGTDAVNKNYVTGLISAEESRAESVEAQLSTVVSTNFSYLISNVDLNANDSFSEVVATFSYLNSVEQSVRESADTSLEAKLSVDMSTEQSVRESADTSLAAKLSLDMLNEVSSRQSADESLEAKLSVDMSTEQSVRQSADTSLASLLGADVSSEASIRLSADTSLNQKIDFVISNTDEVALNSLTEIVIAFQSVDGDLGNTITALSGSASAGIAAANSVRLSADTSLESRVSTEEVTRSTAVSTEESVRTSADTSLESRLSSEESVRLSADNSLAALLGNDLSVEISVRSSADNSLEVRLSNEEVLRTNQATDINFRFDMTPVVKAFTIGDGSALSYTVSHDLNTKDVIVQVFEIATGETVETGSIRKTNSNDVQIDFNTAPGANAFRVVIMGIQLFDWTANQ